MENKTMFPKATAEEVNAMIASEKYWGAAHELKVKREPHEIDEYGTPGYWLVVYKGVTAIAAFVETFQSTI